MCHKISSFLHLTYIVWDSASLAGILWLYFKVVFYVPVVETTLKKE